MDLPYFNHLKEINLVQYQLKSIMNTFMNEEDMTIVDKTGNIVVI